MRLPLSVALVTTLLVPPGAAHAQNPAAANNAGNPTFLRFTRDNGLLSNHPITTGRDQAERVSVVQTFTGQSLTVTPGATALLAL